jgi:hypothetical protein
MPAEVGIALGELGGLLFERQWSARHAPMMGEHGDPVAERLCISQRASLPTRSTSPASVQETRVRG